MPITKTLVKCAAHHYHTWNKPQLTLFEPGLGHIWPFHKCHASKKCQLNNDLFFITLPHHGTFIYWYSYICLDVTDKSISAVPVWWLLEVVTSTVRSSMITDRNDGYNYRNNTEVVINWNTTLMAGGLLSAGLVSSIRTHTEKRQRQADQ